MKHFVRWFLIGVLCSAFLLIGVEYGKGRSSMRKIVCLEPGDTRITYIEFMSPCIMVYRVIKDEDPYSPTATVRFFWLDLNSGALNVSTNEATRADLKFYTKLNP